MNGWLLEISHGTSFFFCRDGFSVFISSFPSFSSSPAKDWNLKFADIFIQPYNLYRLLKMKKNLHTVFFSAPRARSFLKCGKMAEI